MSSEHEKFLIEETETKIDALINTPLKYCPSIKKWL